MAASAKSTTSNRALSKRSSGNSSFQETRENGHAPTLPNASKNALSKKNSRYRTSTENTATSTTSSKSFAASTVRSLSRKAANSVSGNSVTETKEEVSALLEDQIVDPWSQDEVNKVVDLWKLTSAEAEHLVEIGECVKDVNHWKNSPGEVVRFMKARPKSVKAAVTMFRKMVEWRIENNVDTILEDYEPPRLIRDYMPGAVLVDLDKVGDPIYCERIGSADSPEMVHRFGAEHVVKHAIWIREKISQGSWVKEYEKRAGHPVCQILVIEDLHGLSMGHLDRKLLSAFQAITRLDQDNYPEVAKKLVNINAPFIFRMAWSLVKHFFDPNVAEKMLFLSPASTEKVLGEFLDLKALPREIVPQGEGKAAPGLPPNFKGGPLPPIGKGDDESYKMVSTTRFKETASVSSSSGGDGARISRSLESDSMHSGHSSLWSAPVRTYFRKKQAKKDEKKKQELREVRAMAAKRIQPKELSSSQQVRLDRLRGAKQRRTPSDDVTCASSIGAVSHGSEPDHKKSLSLRLTDSMEMHGRKTRFIVMAFLLSLLFILLNPELLEMMAGVKLVGETSMVGWKAIQQGLGFILYTMLCTAVHFMTCDISLVYAFNALDLGSKTGREVKKFYSDNVRLLVAGVSFGIFGISFAKALGRVMLHLAKRKTTAMVGSVSGHLTTFVSEVSESPLVGSLSGHLTTFVSKVSESVVDYPVSPRYDFHADVGVILNEECSSRNAAVQAAHEIAESAQQAAEKAKAHISELSYLVWSKVERGALDEVVVSSWQSDVFHTARLFFSHTAVFLLVFLVLFNYNASSAVSRTKLPRKSTAPKTPFSGFNGTPPVSPTDATRESDDGEFTMHTEPYSATGASADDSSTQRKLRKRRLFKKRLHRPVLGAVKEYE